MRYAFGLIPLLLFSALCFARTVSFCILAHNETSSLAKLLHMLYKSKGVGDEIVVIDDYSTNTQTIKILEDAQHRYGVRTFRHHLDHNFAAQRNFGTQMCRGDYVFAIDSDQLPSLYLMQNMQKILSTGSDIYRVPTVTYIGDCDWRNTNWQGFVNINYRGTLYKNCSAVKWVNYIHEVTDGSEKIEVLPWSERCSVIEHKNEQKIVASKWQFYFECYQKWFRDLIVLHRDYARARGIFMRVYELYRLPKTLELIADEIIVERAHLDFFKEVLSKIFDFDARVVPLIKSLPDCLALKNFVAKKTHENFHEEAPKGVSVVRIDVKSVNKRLDARGITVLMRVAKDNNLALARELVHCDACDVLAPDSTGRIAIDFSQRGSAMRKILMVPTLRAFLKKYGLDFYGYSSVPVDEKGTTVTMLAAKVVDARVFSLLLEYGIEPSIRDYAGLTAIDHAKKARNNAVVDLLKKAPIMAKFA